MIKALQNVSQVEKYAEVLQKVEEMKKLQDALSVDEARPPTEWYDLIKKVRNCPNVLEVTPDLVELEKVKELIK